eukprot:TRINITY_DN1591_c0_g1_i1.p1 TRINITY_DN1591_c0_g1~~TRINITY_DN1591_c0_g1_i1.p1  ORF type:complete len:572 (-),score=115.32 TRINITY_DN1591_c0_g1_i1:121-1806(-)
MVAYSPWNGHYDVPGTAWASAHTTQFADPGWIYLNQGSGSGHLPKGGSYVTLIPPGSENSAHGTIDFSIVIETMSHDMSTCVRPDLPAYSVEKQTVTFNLVGGLKDNAPLYVWYTHFDRESVKNVYFQQVATITPQNGQFSLSLDVDSIYTVTTTTGQRKGQYPTPPTNTIFPLPYYDDFSQNANHSQAKYFTDQTGAFEILSLTDSSSLRNSKPDQVLRQMSLGPSISWCDESSSPVSIIGDPRMCDVSVGADILIEKSGSAVIGGRVISTGCGNTYSIGYFLSVDQNGYWTLSAGLEILSKGKYPKFAIGDWNSLNLKLKKTQIRAFINGDLVSTVTDTKFTRGWAAIGSSWDYVQFDNFFMEDAQYCNCGNLGTGVTMSFCDSYKANQWDLKTDVDGTIRLRSNNSLCLGVAPSALKMQVNQKHSDILGDDYVRPKHRIHKRGRPQDIKVRFNDKKGDRRKPIDHHHHEQVAETVTVLPCDPQQAGQQWRVSELGGVLMNVANFQCLAVNGTLFVNDCSRVSFAPCIHGSPDRLWSYDKLSGHLQNDITDYLCLSAGA